MNVVSPILPGIAGGARNVKNAANLVKAAEHNAFQALGTAGEFANRGMKGVQDFLDVSNQ